MAMTSLIFLLLSNSITLRRDKSTLFSRASITILLTLYSISNLNAFILLITIGCFLYCYLYNTKSITTSEKEKSNENSNNLHNLDNSPIQLIHQLKGLYYINPILSLSLAITLFSFAGIPLLIGFFGKQMILSAAIDNGYIFMSLVAILTSVISAVYYLAIIKQIFFDKPDYTLNNELTNLSAEAIITEKSKVTEKVDITVNNIVLSSSLSLSISIITLVIALFIFIPEELLSLANILALILFNI